MTAALYRFFFLFVILCTGCHKHYMQVINMDVDKQSLASNFALTPDRRKTDPCVGQQLLIEWNLPLRYEKEPLFLEIGLLYRDYSNETITVAIEHLRDFYSYFVLQEQYKKTKGFFSYDAVIKNKNGEVIAKKRHHLWTKLIVIED